MATTVKLRTISAVDDKRIQLSNSCCARKWTTDLGTSWTKIRVGARVSITDSGATLTSTPRFAFGIQSGISNLFLDAGGPTHWAGVVSYEASWGRYVTPVKYDLSGESGPCMKVSKKIATSLTEGSTVASARICIADATVASRIVMFLDITKGSPNFTFNLFTWQNNIGNGAMGDVTLATYLAQIVLASPSITNHAAESATLAVDEASNGYFDSVGFSWNRTDALIELSDVTVVRLS